ncbi:hypothetical protein V6N11_030249 [Hibiscus sabdariffa]|uniref:Uncharacterized protein n=1 Tax=Hibiscus sabdariffa TaxID=183260 RepID=A0ABR2PKR9_9ROSI
MSSLEWNFLFPKAIAIIDVPIASDHTPIVLLLNGVTKRGKKEFKFESRWSLEEECSNIVQEEWASAEERNQRGTFRVKLRRTKVKLWRWNRDKENREERKKDIFSRKTEIKDGDMKAIRTSQ